MLVTSQAFEVEAKLMLGIRSKIEKQAKRLYRSAFGTSFEVCDELWFQLQKREWIVPGGKPKHLLWGLMLMKLYVSETACAAIAGVHRHTFHKWAWILIHAIAGLRVEVVSFFPVDKLTFVVLRLPLASLTTDPLGQPLHVRSWTNMQGVPRLFGLQAVGAISVQQGLVHR